ncbi:flagellar biosynthesis protein FlhF [Pseudobacteroides cellulosolvens]|uniref:Flagellar biosynthesis protein FlhF n=1 Tax=Pseudobacteroides cellulosolvens ATCC 35603 = DSM 2933 TaxID=398512 RepID=A0A0L6JRF5_9FIRM|nr:flagellar biosynthesis protein FlhF [Pseudobacteroides cellulosolvens]KNY28363.1 flagellar biosynthetic protein FlhF [Pseudobacteroides cellulosolvens ATCC 35603 = DSM 2933]
MKIRRYMGSNTQEAILKVKMDLGNEAVILNTRKVRKRGLLNVFAKPMVEVLAAIDDDIGTKKEKGKNVETNKQKEDSTKNEANFKTNLEEKEEKIDFLENKVNNMETMLKKIYEQFQNNAIPSASVPVKQERSEKPQKPYSNVLMQFYNNLIKNEVEEEIAKKLIDTVSKKIGDTTSINDAASMLYNLISGILGKPETIGLKEDKKPTVIIFVGPTGVGKTTTLAKIAANYSLNLRKNVGLITADTYRIAAVEQLKTYAEILGLPVNVIYAPNEIKDAISLYSDKDVVLIDTAGRSYRNKSQFDELKSLIVASEADEVYLVMSSTTSVRNCNDILHNYSFLKDYKLIFTKLDESQVNGIILNTKFRTGKNLSFVTTGQCVPDDIEVLNIDKMTKNLLGSIS